MAEVLVLGAGVAGLSAAWHASGAGRNVVVLEARERWGGLLDHFEIGGFRFDRGVHLAFKGAAAYNDLLRQTELIVHQPKPYNYDAGRWLKHPVQNNLFPLPVDEKVAALKSFIDRPAPKPDADYRQWLIEQYGEVIACRYPARYTKKYWTVPAEKLSTSWIGKRLYRPNLDEMLFGAMSAETPEIYYLPEMYYPQRGGYRSFLEPLMENLEVRTGKEVVRINSSLKYAECCDGSREYYEYLVSSLPLPEMIVMLEDAPETVREAASTLWATSIALVSLGLSCPQNGDHTWFYIYDHHILPARAHAPNRKSPDNVPAGCSSLQFETYYSRYTPLKTAPETLTDHVIDAAVEMKLISREDLLFTDYQVLPYAFVAFDHGMTDRRNIVLAYLDSIGILPIGRFGEWDYLWADQCFVSGNKVLNLPGMV